MRAGHSANASEPYHAGLTELARLVEERSGGDLTLRIFPDNQLGNEKEMIEGLLLGTLDIAVTANGTATNFAPRMGILDLPFLFRDREHMYDVLDGEVGSELARSMQQRGLRLLTYYEAGVRHIMTREQAIHSLDDLKGLKIRTMGVPAHVATFNAFGANAVALAYSELYGALQTGVVDGAEAANTNYELRKFYEVAPYWAQIGWVVLVADVMMSERRFQALPDSLQQILLEAAAESALFERRAYAQSDDSRLDNLKRSGITITYPDAGKFREATGPVYDEFVRSADERRMLESIRSTR